MTDYSGVIELVAPSQRRQRARIFFDETGKDVRIRQPFMADNHGGGQLEDVAGFDKARARVAGLPYATLSPSPPLPVPVADRVGFENFFASGDPMVRVDDTTALPFRSIAYLDLTFTDGSRGFGTGWFAAANTLVTAAHCFLDPETGLAVSSVTVVPGYSNGHQPFQSHRVASIYMPPEWGSSVGAGTPDPLFDYALAYLADPDVGRTASWFGLAAPPNDNLDDLLLNIAGYSSHEGPVAQFYDGGRLVSADAAFLYHRFDTARGMSGAPIIVRRQDRRYVIGIHTWGGTGSNRARRFDNALFDEISRRLS